LPEWRRLATVGLVAAGEVAVGVVTRTGSAVIVALNGVAAAPGFVARREVGLLTAALPAQPYHVAVGLDLAAAEEMIGQVERAAQEAAAAGLRAVASCSPPAALGAGSKRTRHGRPSHCFRVAGLPARALG